MPIALLLLLLPFIGFFILAAFGKKLPRQGDWLALVLLCISFILSIVLLQSAYYQPFSISLPWASLGRASLDLVLWVDATSGLLVLVVSTVTLLVMVYSMAYMKGEANYARYYAYLCLFSGAMLGLIMARNLMWLYIFWELVGVASYLLIGFWQHKPAAARAAKKAFLVNRVGDVGFVVALMALHSLFGTLDIEMIAQALPTVIGHELLWIAGIGLLLAGASKSGQLPFSIWLPDAMEGPTPVSALLHAATMVAAGVYLLLRTAFLFPEPILLALALLGVVTAFLAAISALGQTDIKKVLAYSTISQLGYMMLGIGVGSHEAAFAHLFAHAWFKAGLFLSAGSVIHALHHAAEKANVHFDPQDMRNMGGLRKYLPFTFIAFVATGLALAGLPLFSGFLSKDAILLGAWEKALIIGKWAYLLPIVGLATSLITAAYVGRLLLRIFWGTSRYEEGVLTHVHENGWQMRVPLIILAMLSCWLVLSPHPLRLNMAWVGLWNTGDAEVGHWIAPAAALIAMMGLGIAYQVYGSAQWQGAKNGVFPSSSVWRKWAIQFWGFNQVYEWAVQAILLPFSFFIAYFDKKWLDGLVNKTAKITALIGHLAAWFDHRMLDGLVRLSGSIAVYVGKVSIRLVQHGHTQAYIAWAFAGLIALLIWVL